MGEDLISTRHDKIMLVRSDGNWYGLQSCENFGRWLSSQVEDLYGIAATHDASAIKRKLQEIVPEYTPQQTESVLECAMGGGGNQQQGRTIHDRQD